MKQLESFIKNGHEYTLVERRGDFAVFRGLSKPSRSHFRQSETFELIRIQSHDGRTIAGRDLPPAEYGPSNNEWGGERGRTFTNLQSALEALRAGA